MPSYVIEREIPGVGSLSAEQLTAIAQTSCGVLSELGPSIQWVHSYVTGDKIYCMYIAPSGRAGARARPSRRLSRRPGCGGQDDDRPDHRRGAGLSGRRLGVAAASPR
jgi:hypothetical protein